MFSMPVAVNYKHASEYGQALMGFFYTHSTETKLKLIKKALSNGKLLNLYKWMRLALETGNARNNQEVDSGCFVRACAFYSICSF